MTNIQEHTSGLKDTFGRQISYLRLSVTDRCDLRCRYCMAENMVFLPKAEVLTLEEMLTLCDAFIDRGVRRIRLTGGEPLVRKDIIWLFNQLGKRLETSHLDEITVTTNGTQLPDMARDLYAAGVRRINVSLDTLKRDAFAEITRRDSLPKVMEGIDAALDAGLKVKINTVALKNKNEHEIGDILSWCHSKGIDLTLIETMPLGSVADAREDNYLPLTSVMDGLKHDFDLVPSTHRTGGPARYYSIKGTESKLGLITPLTNNFCDGCNRVRVTCTGRIYMCLGQSDHVDLREAIRSGNAEQELTRLLGKAMKDKPYGHDFAMKDGKMIGTVGRHMSMTGG
ncbi:GTP 3',8-cyclase MoaA [Kordiimonas sp. SCSIO 12610]|uniref:GTP 3',8-cyclase MoaA n=1 Tax=Kordiimonas sp. SCSIO 12610 TaxID=2829597 RepID=UPI00210C6BAB|nr:GTP 3',8-cyclase MoaA [Kordiimonas sp. SCSIO 12610]